MTRLAKYGGTDGSTLEVQVTENITINERDYGGYNTYSIPNIVNITKRIQTITTTESVIASFGLATAAGVYVAAKVKYMRFTNLDDTNFVVLVFQNAHNDEFAVKLDAGKSFVFNADNSGGMVAVMDAKDLAGLTVSLHSLKSITADADSASVDIELYVASTA